MPAAAEGTVLLRGLGAAPGAASGPVRILGSIAGAGKFMDGAVLVTRMTAPDWVPLMRRAAAIATDSGGVQKEAYFYKTPCVTLREETEWVETVSCGWNRLAPPGKCSLVDEVKAAILQSSNQHPQPYGNGEASDKIVSLLNGTPPTLPCRGQQGIGL